MSKKLNVLVEARNYTGWNEELDVLARESPAEFLKESLDTARKNMFDRMVSSSQSSGTIAIDADTPEFDWYPQPDATFYAELKALLRGHQRGRK